MDRDTFKKLSMGHYCYINLQGTIDKDEMLKFSEGAVWAYDFTQREKITSARFMPEPIVHDRWTYDGKPLEVKNV